MAEELPVDAPLSPHESLMQLLRDGSRRLWQTNLDVVAGITIRDADRHMVERGRG